MRKKIIQMILFFFCLFCVGAIAMTPVQAKDKEKIKVGFNQSKGFHEYDEHGNPIGYDVEYLNKMSQHNGWEYEYVYADSWEKAVAMLESGEIDILAPAQITSERLSKFDFSAYSIGMEYGSLLTLQNSKDLIFEDFSQFSNLKIGCVKDFVFVKEFEEYAQCNGFAPDFYYFKNTNELIAGLREGKVDAIVVNLMVAEDDMKVLAKFSPTPFYYMLRKGETELLEELDYAITEIKMNQVNYEEQLLKKYYPIMHITPITKSELEYINSLGPVKVSYVANLDPISYQDEKTGEFKGIAREILDEIQKNSGLKFEYVPLHNGSIDMQYLTDNQIKLVSGVEYNSKNLSIRDMNLSNPYLSSKKVIIAPNGKVFDSDKSFRLAIATGSATVKQVILSEYPDLNIQFYKNTEDCFDAVINGEADIIMQNQYAVERFLSMPKYRDWVTNPVEGLPDEMCLSYISNSENSSNDEINNKERLISVINKSIQMIPEGKISTIIVSQTTSRQYQYTFSDFIYLYQKTIISISIIMLILCIIIAYAVQMKTRNTKIIKENEIRLRSIANNINGGVVVLIPNKGMRITYANEGFLSLLGYTEKEYDNMINSDYVAYVHPEDIDKLNLLVNSKTRKEESISIQLRLLKKEGNYIPILFNGTMTMAVTGEQELYCVIVDITEQIAMLKRLEMEQERYQIIMDNADEMLFDIKKTGITISRRFLDKFGWTFPKNKACENLEHLLSLWKVNEDDKEALKEAMLTIENDKQMSECEVRIQTKDRDYLWCRVSLYPMHSVQEGEIWAIGRILDIDTMVREREELMMISATDSLTGMYHKEAFIELCEEYLQENPILSETAVLFLDLDNFRNVNNLLGHMIGDKAICDTAEKLKEIFSSNGILSRFGGDEFCVFIKNTVQEQLAEQLNQILTNLNRTYANKHHEVSTTVSIGVAYCNDLQEPMSKLLIKADKALYSAKEKGKGCFVFYYEGLSLNGYKGSLDAKLNEDQKDE